MMLVGLAAATAVVAGLRGLWSPCGLSMVSALNPMAERGRGHRYGVTVAWYVAGAVAGGALLGGACAGLAAGVAAVGTPAPVRVAVAVAAALLAAASDSRAVPWRLPTHPRQVNERWIGRYRRWIYAAGFGVQIGTGFATYVMSATVYLAAALAALTGRPGPALLVGVGFGLVRGLGILAGAPAGRPDRLAAAHRRLDAWAGRSLAACAGASALVAAVAAAALGGPLAGAGVVAAAAGGPAAVRGWADVRAARSHRVHRRTAQGRVARAPRRLGLAPDRRRAGRAA
jgi:MFS family permease